MNESNPTVSDLLALSAYTAGYEGNSIWHRWSRLWGLRHDVADGRLVEERGEPHSEILLEDERKISQSLNCMRRTIWDMARVGFVDGVDGVALGTKLAELEGAIDDTLVDLKLAATGEDVLLDWDTPYPPNNETWFKSMNRLEDCWSADRALADWYKFGREVQAFEVETCGGPYGDEETKHDFVVLLKKMHSRCGKVLAPLISALSADPWEEPRSVSLEPLYDTVLGRLRLDWFGRYLETELSDMLKVPPVLVIRPEHVELFGRPVDGLTGHPRAILDVLAEQPEHWVSRQALCRHPDINCSVTNLPTHVAHLRDRLRPVIEALPERNEQETPDSDKCFIVGDRTKLKRGYMLRLPSSCVVVHTI